MRKSIFLIICFLMTGLNFIDGQELRVKNFQEHLTDISARESQVLDINNSPCALVKIYTGLSGLLFDGNRGVEQTKIMPGVVMVWLPEGTRQLKISRAGIPMFVYSLPVELKSSMVYSFDLETDQLFSIIINTGNITADVIIRDTTYNTNKTLAGFPDGKYPLRIQKLGYLTIEDTIEVNASSLYFSYSLMRAEQSVLRINSNPSGAVVLIDGEHVGATNFSGYRFPGEYRLQITLANYLPIDSLIAFDPVGQTNYDFELVRNTGWFLPVIVPADADISIDGASVFPGMKELSAGAGHSISVNKYRYRTITEPFSVGRGDTLTMSISLEPEQGDFSFIIEPNDAAIELKKNVVSLAIDREFELKKWTGSTQMTMPVGEYSLEAARKGYLKVDTVFAITDLKTKYITLTLPEKKLQRGVAFFTSLLFPGMGQFYSQRNVAGSLFFTSGLLSLGASGYFFYTSETLAKEYNLARTSYQEETDFTLIATKREEMDAAYTEYLDNAKIRDISFGVTAGIWFINILDATIFTKMYKPVLQGNIGNNSSYGVTPSAGLNSIGASLSIKF